MDNSKIAHEQDQTIEMGWRKRMTRHTFIIIFSFLLMGAGLLVLNTRPAAAQQPQPTPSDDAVNQVARQLYCPVCENIPLDVCPTQACHDWRELIRQKLAQGWTTQQIKDYFAAQYGDRVLNEPPRSGLNWLVYFVPPVGFLIGAALVWRAIAMMRKNGSSPVADQSVPPSGPHDDPYLARLEEELKQKERQ